MVSSLAFYVPSHNHFLTSQSLSIYVCCFTKCFSVSVFSVYCCYIFNVFLSFFFNFCCLLFPMCDHQIDSVYGVVIYSVLKSTLRIDVSILLHF